MARFLLQLIVLLYGPLVSVTNNNDGQGVLMRMGYFAVIKHSNLQGLKQQRFVSHSYHTSSRMAGRHPLTEQSHPGLPRERVLAEKCSAWEKHASHWPELAT